MTFRTFFTADLSQRFSAMKSTALRYTVPTLRYLAIATLAVTGWQLGTPSALADDISPRQIRTLLNQLDEAATAGDLDAVMRFYAPDFRHSDGLDFDALEDTLSDLWDTYPSLNYDTELLEWDETSEGLVTETLTTITGRPLVASRVFDFTAVLTSRQTWVDGQMVEQTVLSEESQLTSGMNPPDVLVNLPEEVLIAREFPFDAIVMEPLGDRRLLGIAIDEEVSIDGYFDEFPELDMEFLSAGGLFKVGQAPIIPGSRWISGVIIREDGITIETRRLNVVTDLSDDPNE